MPRIIRLISFKKMVVILSGLILILFMAGCGGGGGGGGEETPAQPLPGDSVIVAGTVDDGTSNSPIMRAKCAFVDLNGDNLGETTADNIGRFSINVLPDKEGYIRCVPPDIPKLILSTFLSTKGLSPADKISGEDVTPTTTVVADIIDHENATIPLARKLELLNAIENEDPELSLLVKLSTKLCKAMLIERINVPIGSDRPGEGGAGGGGAGGDAGDGGDFSPIPNAVCDFAIDLEGEALFSPALEDLRDGELNRPDLAAIKGEVDPEFQDPQMRQDIKEAFDKWFAAGLGKPYREVADGNGSYFLPIPPNVQGFVRCTPPNQPQLKLATLVPKLQEGEKIGGQDVTPATTFFSHSIATKLSGDLSTVKENYLDDTAGLGDIHIVTDGETITEFQLSGDPIDNDVGLVAFSATSLFNILYKNEIDVDYLAALDDLIDKKKVDADFLLTLGVPAAKTEEWSNVVNTSNEGAGAKLGTDLASALSKARIRVKVTDRPGGDGIPGATINIIDPPSDVVCENCPGITDQQGEVILTLTGVPETEAIQIKVEASLVAGFEPTTRTTQVVAFATVDLEIALTPEFLLQVSNSGTGGGTVTSSPAGINCGTDCTENYIDGTVVSLTATANADSNFTGWSGGGCNGTSDCTVTMNQAHTVIATFTLKACTYSISPASQSFGADGGSGSISVSASASGCSWTATASEPWITITSGSSGSGNGTLGYSVTAYTGTSTRTATITVAGKSYTVTQTQIPDTTAPTVTITTPTSGTTYTASSSSLTIAGTASDNVGVTQVTWTNDRGGSGTCSGTTSWSQNGISLSSGTNVITVTARDAAGNTRSDTLTVTYTPPDTTRPTVTITSPTSGTTYTTSSSSLTIAGTASDNVGVTQVTWANDFGPGGICSGTTSWSQTGVPLFSGENLITVTARDAAGNTRSDTLTVTYTPPVTTRRLTVQGGSTGTGFVSSTPSGFSCSIDGTNESGVCSQTYSSGTEVTLLADPSRGSTIDGWSVGGCGTATSCSVTMDQAQTVTVFFKLPPVPPEISNISSQNRGTSDTCKNSSGGDFTGTLFDIRFEYADMNGDVSKSGGATVDAGFDATPFSTFSGDGFSGSITSNLCFAGSSRDVTMTLTDNSGLSSNSLTVRVSP